MLSILKTEQDPEQAELVRRTDRLRALVSGTIETLDLPNGIKIIARAAVTQINESNVDSVLQQTQDFLGAAYIEVENIKNGIASETKLELPGTKKNE